MSLARTIRRARERMNATLDTLEGLGRLPKTESCTMALAGNTFSGARRRMAKGEKPRRLQVPTRAVPVGQDRTAYRKAMRRGIKSLKKFDAQQMAEIQQDIDALGAV